MGSWEVVKRLIAQRNLPGGLGVPSEEDANMYDRLLEVTEGLRGKDLAIAVQGVAALVEATLREKGGEVAPGSKAL